MVQLTSLSFLSLILFFHYSFIDLLPFWHPAHQSQAWISYDHLQTLSHPFLTYSTVETATAKITATPHSNTDYPLKNILISWMEPRRNTVQAFLSSGNLPSLRAERILITRILIFGRNHGKSVNGKGSAYLDEVFLRKRKTTEVPL